MAPTTKRNSNPDVKGAEIAFTRPTPRNLERGQFHAYKQCTTPADTDSPTYKLSIPFLMKGCLKSGSSSGVGYKQCSMAKM
eukprot:13785475-Ditylum_brightwellii.AAC.1